jgi:hypothetical protein
MTLPPLESGVEKDKSMRVFPPAAESFVGALGIVRGIVDNEVLAEYPTALDASTKTV